MASSPEQISGTASRQSDPVERIYIEGEEYGWELVVETANVRHRHRVHGLASSGELALDLQKILDTLADQGRG